MKKIDFGKISVPLDTYASQGNAVLGIRGSGKSYSATYIAERMLDAGVPIVAFDPIGIWRFLRIPADGGHGYKVVVAGGEHGDIPLPANGASEIMRAAMRDGVSIIFDLYDINLSKGDWRRVVESAVKVLLYENKVHGLRHIFLEEAAEFCPQRVGPEQGMVYSAIERLARMGGNAQLGYTLINQRAEEVNKAVLELCDLLILHRQKGRNSLTALSKWLDVAQAKGEIAAKIPVLENGEAYIWPAGDAQPVRTKIPEKRTFHPDRKAMQKAVAAEAKSADVSAFVANMRTSLQALSKEADENDPKKLKARVRELEKQLAGKEVVEKTVEVPVLKDADLQRAEKVLERLQEHGDKVLAEVADLRRAIGSASARPAPRPQIRPMTPVRRAVVADSGDLSKVERAFLTVLAQQARPLTRNQVAIFAGYSSASGHVDNTLSALRTKGFVSGQRDGIQINADGVTALGDYDPLPTGQALRDYWLRELDKAQSAFLRVICEAYPNGITRDEVAERAGYSPQSGHVDNTLSALRSRDLIGGHRGEIKASDTLFD